MDIDIGSWYRKQDALARDLRAQLAQARAAHEQALAESPQDWARIDCLYDKVKSLAFDVDVAEYVGD